MFTICPHRVKCPNGLQGTKNPFPKGPQLPDGPLKFFVYSSAIMTSQRKILDVSWCMWTFIALTIINTASSHACEPNSTNFFMPAKVYFWRGPLGLLPYTRYIVFYNIRKIDSIL